MNGFLIAVLLLATSDVALGQSPDAGSSAARKHVEGIVNTLPNTAFRKFIEHSALGAGTSQPYMSAMERTDVKRALIDVRGFSRRGELENPQIASRVYFRKYDGRGAKITDPGVLQALSATELPSLLDQAAIEKAKEVRPFCVHTCPDLEGKQVLVQVELYDDPWLLPSPPSIVLDVSRPPALLNATGFGDADLLRQILQNKQFTRRELSLALWEAVSEYRDNTEVMELLVLAGADVNFRMGEDKKTVLMVALRNPVHVKFLIEAGARVNDKDCCNETALAMAERAHEEDSANLLRQVNAKP
jgi:hypothetical protein